MDELARQRWDLGVACWCVNAPHEPSEINRVRATAAGLCAKVKVLPDHIFACPPGYPGVVRSALVDSFFVSVRTLLEFLLIHPPRKTDFTAARIKTGWTPQLTPTQSADLNAHWEAVSKHLVHFSAQRAEAVQVDEALVRALATDVLSVWDQFAAASRHPLVPLAADNHMYDKPASVATP